MVAILSPTMAARAEERTESAISKEIIVTAQRREQEISDVSQSIQYFSGASLERQGVDNLDTTLLKIPGASLGFRTSPGTAQYNLRGTGGQGQLGDMAVGFYIDDVPYYTPDNPYAPAIRFFDLEAVEVLRGPQGTLYGQGAVGGTIIVRTSNPDLDKIAVRGRTRRSFLKGGESAYQFDGTASVPILPGKVALRVTGGYEKLPGLAESRDFPDRKNIDDGSIRDLRAKLLAKPVESISIVATYWDTISRGDFTPTYASNDPPTLDTGGVRGRRDNRTRLAGVVVDWLTSLGTLKSSTSLNKYRDSILLGVGVNLPGAVPAAFKIDLDARSKSFNQSLNFASVSGSFEWILGASYTNAERDTDFAQNLDLVAPPITLFSVATVTRTKTRQIAAFGEVSRALANGVIRPLIGLRYYRDARRFSDAPSNTPTIFRFDKVFKAVSPRFNLAIRPGPNQELYVNVAKGFRSGNFNPQAFVDLAQTFGVDSRPANPEADLWAYEAGARLKWLDGDLVVEPALYYNDFSDYQFAGIVGGVTLVSLRLESVRSVGADLIARYDTPLDGLTVGFAGNVNKTIARNLDPLVATQVASLKNGQQLPYTPKWNYTAYANFEQPLNSRINGFGYLSVSSVGRQRSNSAEEFSPAVMDVALRFGVRNDDVSVTFFAQNLLNQRRPFAIRSSTNQIRRDTRSLGADLIFAF